MISTLITNRTLSDILGKTDKGYYNYTDLNRIGEAVESITERLNGYGCAVTSNPKTDWNVADIPDEATLSLRILGSLSALRSAISVKTATPQVPASMNKLYYTTANEIEQILYDIDLLIDFMESAFRFCGDEYTGG